MNEIMHQDTPAKLLSMIARCQSHTEADDVAEIAAHWCANNRVEMLRLPPGTFGIPQYRRKLAEFGVSVEVSE